jgi:anti-sigma factor RsiW
MATDEDHDVEVLGVYALGLLDDQEAQAIDEHLVTCAECRTVLDELVGVHQMLAFAPPAAFADAAPAEPDLPAPILTMRAPRRSGARIAALVAAAAAVLGLAVAGGVLIGQRSTGAGLAAPTTVPTTTVGTPPVSGVRYASISTAGGARLTVRLEPAPGWVRINAAVSGIPSGVRCQLVVVSRTGERRVAVTWLVSPKGEATGTNLDGGVLIPAEQVDSIVAESLDGKEFVSAKV